MALPLWLAPLDGSDDTARMGDRHGRGPGDHDAAAVQHHEDHALLIRLRTGDEQALGDIIDAHYVLLCRNAYRILGTVDLAESATLDVLTSMWNRRATLEVQGSLRGYLVGAVRLRAMNIARTRRTEEVWRDRVAREETVPGMSRDVSDAAARLAHDDLARAVHDAIEQLPPRCRTVFELIWYGGLSYADVAAQLNISIKGVEAQMSRAYRSLRTALASLA